MKLHKYKTTSCEQVCPFCIQIFVKNGWFCSVLGMQHRPIYVHQFACLPRAKPTNQLLFYKSKFRAMPTFILLLLLVGLHCIVQIYWYGVQKLLSYSHLQETCPAAQIIFIICASCLIYHLVIIITTHLLPVDYPKYTLSPCLRFYLITSTRPGLPCVSIQISGSDT